MKKDKRFCIFAMLFFIALFSCKIDDGNKGIDERESFQPVFYLRIKNSSNYKIDRVVFFDGQAISQPKFYIGSLELSSIADSETKDVEFLYLETNSYHYARYIKLYLSDLSKVVTIDFGFDLSYAIEKRQRTIPETIDPIFGFELLEDFSVKNLYHDKTYPTTISYSSFGKNDALKSQIDNYLDAQREYDNGLSLSVWEKLGEFVKTGQVIVSYGGTVIPGFSNADDIINYFGITLEDGLYSDLFGLLTIAVNEAYASDVYAATDEVEANYIETHELPVAPIRILASKFSEIAWEDDEYIHVDGEASIKKSSYDNRELLYYYAGIIPDYYGVKGVVSSSTKLWKKDPKNDYKYTMPFYIPPQKSAAKQGFLEIGLKAAMEEIVNATNGAICFREVKEVYERRYYTKYVTAGYYSDKSTAIAHATVGAGAHPIIEVNEFCADVDNLYVIFKAAADKGLFSTSTYKGGYKTLKLYGVSENELQEILGDSLLVTKAPRIYSWLGAFQHELLHNLGLNHEQQRYDRNNYLAIPSTAISNHNNAIIFSGKTFAIHPQYDYLSIMHYDGFRELSSSYSSYTGSNTLSEIDKEFLAGLYGVERKSPLDKLFRFSYSYVGFDGHPFFEDLEFSSLGGATNGGLSFLTAGINFKDTLDVDFCTLGNLNVDPDLGFIDLNIEKFYGQTVELINNGVKFEILRPVYRWILAQGKNEINIDVTSQDKMNRTIYNLILHRPITDLKSISIKNGDDVIASKSQFTDDKNFYFGGAKAGKYKIVVDGYAGQKILVNGANYELDANNCIEFEADMSSGFSNEYLIDVSYPDALEKVTYKVIISREHIEAMAKSIKISYDAVLKDGKKLAVKNFELKNHFDDIYIGTQSATTLSFKIELTNEMQKLYYEVIGEKSIAKTAVLDPRNLEIVLPINSYHTVKFFVSAEGKENCYTARFYCYNWLTIRFVFDDPLKIRIPNSKLLPEFEGVQNIVNNTSVTVPSVLDIAINVATPIGYLVYHNCDFLKSSNSGSTFTFDPSKKIMGSREIRLMLSPISDVGAISFSGGWSGKNYGSLTFKFDQPLYGVRSEGKFLVYLKSPTTRVGYRVTKTEVQGGGVLLLDLFENHRNYPKPTHPRLGRGFLYNGDFPSANDWYYVNAQNNYFILGRLKQDVTSKVAVDGEIQFCYEMGNFN